MNVSIITGRLTSNLEVKQSKETKWVNFTVAVDRGYSDETDFINCTAWNGTAENMANFLGKGSKVNVMGALRQNVWEDENKKKHYETYINAERVDFLESRPREEEEEPKRYNRNSRGRK